MTGYEIFSPLIDLKAKSSKVFISTWGLGSPKAMEPVILNLNGRHSQVSLLVGYAKTHNLPDLLANIRAYKKMSWDVRVMPSFHAKVWIINGEAWVGSANFTRGTITNLMVQVPRRQVDDFVSMNWQQAYEISSTTDLSLIPQAKFKVI